MTRLDLAAGRDYPKCNIMGVFRFTDPRELSNSTQLRTNQRAHEIALATELAIQHLNEGNGTLVPEVKNLDKSCPITFSVSFFDTKNNPAEAFEIVDTLTGDKEIVPCAFLGARSSTLSKTTGLVTGIRGVPQISMASTSTSLNDKSDYPLFGRTIPDDSIMAERFVQFLHNILKVRHVFVIFESRAYTRSILTSIKDAISNNGWDIHLENRIIESPGSNETLDDNRFQHRLQDIIQDLKNSNFRYVISLTTAGDLSNMLMEIAYDQGVAGDGAHSWWFFESTGLENVNLSQNLNRAYDGVGSISQSMDTTSPLYDEFHKQSSELKQQLYENANESEWLTLQEDQFFIGDQYSFQYPSFAYDATILLGLSACREIEDLRNPKLLTGRKYFERIKKVNFEGLTGPMDLDDTTGTRVGNTVKYVIENWLPNTTTSDGTTFKDTTTYVFLPNSTHWTNVSPFVFNGNQTTIPLGLPPVDMYWNTVNIPILGLAWALAAIILLSTTGATIWTYCNRKSRIVRASQPFFLYLLCFGIALQGASIIPLSFIHWNYFQTSATCHWDFGMFQIGLGITCSTLMAKTYRINKIMASSKKCRRVTITVAQTLYPVVINLCINIILLSLMFSLAPLTLEIVTSNPDIFGRDTEEYSQCSYTSSLPYFWTILAVNFATAVLALWQAWRARYLSTEFAESDYIAKALLIILIIWLFAFPVILLTRQNPDVDTFVQSVKTFAFAFSVLGFIFIPKILMWHRRRSLKSAPAVPNISSLTMSGGTHNFAMAYGERIVTTKPQDQLASEMKALVRENGILKKTERTLTLQNEALLKRLEELSSLPIKDEIEAINSNSKDEAETAGDSDDESSDDDSIVMVKTTHSSSGRVKSFVQSMTSPKSMSKRFKKVGFASFKGTSFVNTKALNGECADCSNKSAGSSGKGQVKFVDDSDEILDMSYP